MIHTIFLDRIVAFVTLLVVILAGLPGLGYILNDTAMVAALGGLSALGLLGFSAFLMVDKVVARVPRGRLLREISILSAGARKFVFDWTASIPVFFASVATHLVSILVVMIVAWGCGVNVRLYELVLLVPPVMFLAMLPFSLAGWGVREGAMVFALGYVGIAREDAFAVSVLLGIVSLIISLPGGLLLFKAAALPQLPEASGAEVSQADRTRKLKLR